MGIETKRRQRSSWLAVALGAALVLVLAACGSDSTNETSTGTTVPSADAPSEEPADSSGAEQLTEPPAETDFFTITVDGEQLDGSGLVFDNGGELSLRGLFGAEMDHLQLDLTSSGFGEQTPTIFGPVLSRVIGLDASSGSYELVEDASNRLSINERGPALTVWGDFSFQALDTSTGEQVTVSGVFDVPIGSGDWDCDWAGDPPACGFIS